MVKAMSFIQPNRTTVGVAAMVFLVVAAATLQAWPFRITALGIASGPLLMTLFPEKPKDFKVGLHRITQVARSIPIHDSGIGLHQRWYFDLRLKEESERCRRYGYSMAVVVLKVLPPRLRIRLGGLSRSGLWKQPALLQARFVLSTRRPH